MPEDDKNEKSKAREILESTGLLEDIKKGLGEDVDKDQFIEGCEEVLSGASRVGDAFVSSDMTLLDMGLDYFQEG